MKEENISTCLNTIYKGSDDMKIISAYREYREIVGLPRYPEGWNYYDGDPKMQKAMYLSILDELHSRTRNLHTT